MGPLWQQTAERMVSFMSNIFVEGIQGAGKSTLVNQLQKAVILPSKEYDVGEIVKLI